MASHFNIGNFPFDTFNNIQCFIDSGIDYKVAKVRKRIEQTHWVGESAFLKSWAKIEELDSQSNMEDIFLAVQYYETHFVNVMPGVGMNILQINNKFPLKRTK